ncbi:phage terminase large subunit family protein [Neorhizobium petrolearium]|uniref:phage terminase large subunit family protein n=1 Tax=Neorhizobium petrolearium TaxID=515361 RepID=UPI003F187577
METLDRVARNAMQTLRPPPRLRLSDWIESELRLPAGVSATPGPVHLWPFQRAIADSIGDPATERVTVVKSVRVGYSTLLSAAIGSYIANEPSPILLLMPTEADCRDVVVSDLEPIFESSLPLRGLLSAEADETGRNTLLSRRFPGGSLKIVPSRAPRNLRRHNVRILLCDEVDGMENTAEGDPLLLAERRTLSFPNRKIVVGSTPVFEDGRVLSAYALSDMRIYECPCPYCGMLSEIVWKDIVWPEGEPQKAEWRCPSCSNTVPERLKAEMVANGGWRATRPEVIGHHGYKLNALISPHVNASWGRLAQEFVAAKGNPDNLRVFVNTYLAEGWRDGGEELDEDGLRSRTEPFGLRAIPEDVILVTCGVDMQDNWADFVITGHGRTETFVLASGQIHGRYDSADLWLELDDLLKTTWPHPRGGRIKVDAALVDSGDGEHQPHVYAFARPRFNRRIAASKGMAGFSRPFLERSSVKGTPVFVVGSDSMKNSIFNRLSAGGSIRFSADLPAKFFEELVSERRVVKYTRGQPSRAFERIPGRRAESLDALVYAIAARGLINADLDRREAELSTPAAPQRPPAVIRSAWLDR